MVIIVNADWGPNKITFKYFGPGHSFTKADSVQGQTGNEWKKRNMILDINDFVDVVNKSSKKNQPVLLSHTDFMPFKDGKPIFL